MTNGKKINWFGVFLFLALQMVALVYMRGLGQRNVETLFFSAKGLKEYRHFLKNFEERKLLLAKVTFSSDLNEENYENFYKAIETLRKKFPQVEILTFFDLYKFSLKENDLGTLQKFLKEKPSLNLKFIGPDYLVFLAVFQERAAPEIIESFISGLKTKAFFRGQNLQMAGLPYINYLLDRYSRNIKFQLFPILFVVVFLVTLIFTRNLLTSIILFIPALGAQSITLALLKLFYHSLNMVTSIVPLLIFVLNLSLAFHFFFAFLEYGSLKRALEEKRVPFLLMVSTTAIGFGTLALSDIPAIHQFGVLSFSAILLTSSLTFLWAYSTFSWRIQKDAVDHLEWIPLKFFFRTWSRPTVWTLTLAIFIASFLVFPKIPLNTDATSYFSKKSGLQKSIRGLEEELLGVPILELDISKKAGGELAYEDLQDLDKLEADIYREFGGKRNIFSADQAVREANYLYTGEKKLPDFEISYFTLKGQTAAAVRQQYPTSGHYRLTLFGPTMDYRPYLQDVNRVKKILQRYPKFQANYNGIYFHIMQAQNSLIRILLLSFLMSLMVIALLFFAYFRKWKLLLVFLWGNVVPVLACILFFFVCRFSFNVATVMVFSVSMGMVVDNTFHIIYVLTKRNPPPFKVYFKTNVIPILIGSLTLILGFSLLGFYGFVPIREFGTALAFTLFLAMLFALYLVPTLVTKTTELRKFLTTGEKEI